MSEISIISSNNSATAIISSDIESNAAIININPVAAPVVIASSVMAQGAQGDNDNAIAYSIALG